MSQSQDVPRTCEAIGVGWNKLKSWNEKYLWYCTAWHTYLVCSYLCGLHVRTYLHTCVPTLAVTTELKALTFLHAQSHGVQLIPVVVYPIYQAAYMLIII